MSGKMQKKLFTFLFYTIIKMLQMEIVSLISPYKNHVTNFDL